MIRVRRWPDKLGTVALRNQTARYIH